MNEDLARQFDSAAFTRFRDNSGMIDRGANGGDLDVATRMPINPHEPIALGFANQAVVHVGPTDANGCKFVRHHMVQSVYCRWCGNRNPNPVNGVSACLKCDLAKDWPEFRKTIK